MSGLQSERDPLTSGQSRLNRRERFVSAFLTRLPVRHGKHRILDQLLPYLGDHEPGLRAIREQGHQILIDSSDLVGRHYCLLRSFDPEVVEVMSALIRPSGADVIWDIGANKGTFCYQILRTAPGTRVVAIEPQRDLADLIERNLHLLNLGRSEVFRVAIGTSEGSASLYIPGQNRGAATFHPSDRLEQPSASDVVVVDIVTASWVKDQSAFGWPTLVKIDVEGHESSVIESLSPAFESGAIRAAVFEFNSALDDAWRCTVARLEDAGYAVLAVQKSPRRTWLVSVREAHRRATDYAAIRHDIVDVSPRGVVTMADLRSRSK